VAYVCVVILAQVYCTLLCLSDVVVKQFTFAISSLDELLVNDISFMAILAGDRPSESVKVRHSPLSSENLTNNQHNLVIVQDRRKLVLSANRKSYMSFRFVPKSVTLNDLERHNRPA